MNAEKWKELKNRGSEHYKNLGLEPIDYYTSLGIFYKFAIANIIKYASRNSSPQGFNPKDMDKIIHYAELLKAYME